MSKKIKYPAILIAHDLLSGQVIYWAGEKWEKEFSGAITANNDDDAGILENIAQKYISQNQVVDAELVSVNIIDNKITPEHFRVKIKVSGPTIIYGAI
ncbi:MAG: DUF2849 domain-containing protein [Caulobacterales bacterium]|nr:DUF2849 domain-containing protein [Caulobacterales bacterium]MCA0372597.1 DUF2849 domain-containing protein [Pseudomonadota bacterium]